MAITISYISFSLKAIINIRGTLKVPLLCYNMIEMDVFFMVETVLCYLEKDNQYLMLFRNKKENDMNKGKWLGVGGHINPLESMDDAIDREILEETGFTALKRSIEEIFYLLIMIMRN